MTTFRLVSAVLLVLLIAPVSYTADIAVNETCTLADAIKAANNDNAVGGCPAGDGADVITLSADITLDRALPLVTSEMTIEGTGFSIHGNRRTHIFGVNSRGALILNNMTISNGRAGWGGAIGNLGGKLTINESIISNSSADLGGAIGNEGAVTIYRSIIRKNSAENEGGAIHNIGGTINIVESSFSGNKADTGGGAIHSEDGNLTISKTVFAHNSTARLRGGAIYVEAGTLTITDSTFTSNRSIGNYFNSGGAIYNMLSARKDIKLNISSSAFYGNSASEDGGAIYNGNQFLTITNSTFISNTAGNHGGAIYNGDYSTLATISNSTFMTNSARKDGGGLYVHPTRSTVKLHNTIIAGSNRGGDCYGRLAENIGNLIEDGSCFAELSGDPMLGESIELEDGSLAFFPLLEGSPAIDAANRRQCEKVDQIGTARPQGGGCDIGAIEFVAAGD